MRIQLRSYQEAAVQEILENLEIATKIWIENRALSSVSLSAVTGSGKTVIAAAVIEALYHGSDEYQFHTDRSPVVLWVSDDPSLNEQTSYRISSATNSDILRHENMEIIKSSFGARIFNPGKIYFLNTQKLGKRGILGGQKRSSDSDIVGHADSSNTTLWDTINNTISSDEMMLYFVLDEAHRGMKSSASEDETHKSIARKLIDGHNINGKDIPPMPVVLGISATSERFDSVMGETKRSFSHSVKIPIDDVRASGLVKDSINIDVPDQRSKGALAAFVERGAEKFAGLHDAWTNYCRGEGMDQDDFVTPLMILQVQNTPDEAEIEKHIETILKVCGDRLKLENVFNVFGEHRTEKFGKFCVDYIKPERIQDDPYVRLVIAKDAISLGWDCPRAEVMVSLRAAKDRVHITQLIGRMMRTPLTELITGHQRLNEVDCILPMFNRGSVEAVVRELTGQEADEDGLPRHVLVNPILVNQNPKIDNDVWESFETIKTYSIPRRRDNPVSRLMKLAHLLSQEELLDGAGKIAYKRLFSALDKFRSDQSKEFDEVRHRIQSIQATSLTISRGEVRSSVSFDMEANEGHIDEHFKISSRVLSLQLAIEYQRYLAKQYPDRDYESSLRSAKIDVATLGQVDGVDSCLADEAEDIIHSWLNDNDLQVAMKNKPSSVQFEYWQIRSTGSDLFWEYIVPPHSFSQMSSIRLADGSVESLPRYENHIYCDEDGYFPDHLNDLEKSVINYELRRPDVIGWYRNQPKGPLSFLGIAYCDGDRKRTLRPDFVVFSRDSSGNVRPSIVDPHGSHLLDALSKLVGLADYAEEHDGTFLRIQCITQVSNRVMCIDMTDSHTRDVVRAAKSISEIFEDDCVSREYFSRTLVEG